MTRLHVFKKGQMADIQSGDLIAWDYYPYSSISDKLIKGIAKVTGAPFGHVGVAWKLEYQGRQELMVVEATIPRVQCVWMGNQKNFCFMPMDIVPDHKATDFLLSKVGLEYSLMDAYRSFVGQVVEDDDRYQCAELVSEFYDTCGLDLDTDGSLNALIAACRKHNGDRILRVV